PDFRGAIGVTKNSIEGAETVVPASSRTIKRQMSAAAFTNAYMTGLEDLTGNYNDAPFMGREAGEVRFDGATWDQPQAGAPIDVTYKFTISRNVTGLTVAGITDIDKLGWQYLWVLYEEIEDASAGYLVQRAVAVYIEDLPNCQPMDFVSSLGFTVS